MPILTSPREDFSESQIQALLMSWCMDDRKHVATIPNTYSVYNWECDLLSVTRSLLSHEYEIKISLSDYKADFRNKKSKHRFLENNATYYKTKVSMIPNYFWYVTRGFEVDELPEYAGWITLTNYGTFVVKKSAPRIHAQKMTDKRMDAIMRGNSYKLKSLYLKHYLDLS